MPTEVTIMFLNSFKIIGILYSRKLICRFYKIKEHSYGSYEIYMGSLRIFSTFGPQIKNKLLCTPMLLFITITIKIHK
jgi:hypothetical protein